jgi:DNA-binding NarL/FixJ family response regulator
MAITVGVVEDEAFSRMALVTALRAHGVHVLFESDGSANTVEMFTVRRPRVGVFDIHLGRGPSGVDLAVQVRRHDPSIGLVFLTSFDEPRLLGSSLPPLPTGSVYLAKSEVATITTLLRSIEDAAMWKAPNPTGAQAPIRRLRSPRPTPMATTSVDDLTDDQLETLRLVAAGFSNAEIARRRVVREKSVEVMIGRIAKRLGLEPDAARNQRVHLARVYLRMLGAKDAHD